ncbi:MAG: UDP-N-acetylmuramate dehydrogenase [Balneolaceae bacterium]
MPDSTGRPPLRRGVDLAPYHTFGVSCTSDHFLDITSADELHTLHQNGFFEKHEPIILGGGSNTLFCGRPTRPIVRIAIRGIEPKEQSDGVVHLTIGGGENWHDVVTWAVDRNLGGIENLALIPGTAGAAPVQNIGAYGVELDQVFVSCTVFDTETGSLSVYGREACAFAYRDSIFKREQKGRAIITDCTLKLTTHDHALNRSYQSLAHYLEQRGVKSPSIRDIYEAVIAIRSSKLPDPKALGNAGSFFKNPVLSVKTCKALQEEYTDIPYYPAGDHHVKVPAGWLIDQAGWRGKRHGAVGTYEKQALVIVNHGGARGRDIYDFAMEIRQSVLDRYGIELTPEVNLIGIEDGDC